MKVSYQFDHVGTTCSRCGSHIKHVFTVEDNGVAGIFGSECIHKVSSISDWGMKQIKKAVSGEKKYKKQIADMSSMTAEEVQEKYPKIYGEWYYSWKDRMDFPSYIEKKIELFEVRIGQEYEELNMKIKNAVMI